MSRLTPSVPPVPEAVVPALLVTATHGENVEPLERLPAGEGVVHREVGQDQRGQPVGEGIVPPRTLGLHEVFGGHTFESVLPNPVAEGPQYGPLDPSTTTTAPT